MGISVYGGANNIPKDGFFIEAGSYDGFTSSISLGLYHTALAINPNHIGALYICDIYGLYDIKEAKTAYLTLQWSSGAYS